MSTPPHPAGTLGSMESPPEVVVDDVGRPEPPLAADERATLLGFLEFQRSTFAWKSSGLDADGLAATVAASSMTLGGMLKHLAWVEEYWFVLRLHGEAPAPVWRDVDWARDPDWDWHSAADDPPEELHALWAASVDRARASVDRALAHGGLAVLARQAGSDHGLPSLRWMLVHMIEEYARHNGHADLIRESVDGTTGE